MLSSNDLLRTVDLNPSLVRLVRHREPNVPRTVVESGIKRNPAFDEYHEHQDTERVITQFRATAYLAGFAESINTEDLC